MSFYAQKAGEQIVALRKRKGLTQNEKNVKVVPGE